jgi:alpha-L-fucosidase 2
MNRFTKKIIPILSCLTLISCSEKKEIIVQQLPMNWWYDTPAHKYWEGLPIGTGRFGAMVPGSIDHEIIAFNEETLWTGGPYNPNNPEGPKILGKIREYAFAHNWHAAHNETWKLASDPVSVQYYQPMGRLNFQMNGHEPLKTTAYRRSLSMDSALVQVRYQHEGVNYVREVFASFPDQVIVVRLTADKKQAINLSGWLTSLQPSATTRVVGDEIIMEGTVISEHEDNRYDYRILAPQMRWCSTVKVIPEGGSLTAAGDQLIVKDADAVTLILAGATNWVAWNEVSADEKKRCNDYLHQASRYTYTELRKRHLDDYCPLFAACKIDLGADPVPQMTTTESMQRIRQGEINPAFEARYFQYGRYLMLAAARENTLAFNNHNLWLDNMQGRWRGRWTLNINLQECYWPVENTNLPRVNESLLLFVEQLAQAGARTAKELYHCRGWCAHLGTDIWFNTAPTDGNPQHAAFAMGGVWLMQQLYDHYLYHPDAAYLTRIYPLLKGAAEFCLDFLVKHPETGYRVTCPATSPENSFVDDAGQVVSVSYGSSSDNQQIRCLFRNCIRACDLLHTDADLKQQMTDVLAQLPPHQIGRFGQLQEWLYDFTENEVTHRHLSHLFALYPDDDITLRKTPALEQAARVVLQRRGDINRGWSGAWKINLHARLEEPAAAYSILHKMLTDISIHPLAEDSESTPSFEGNQGIQGVTAGMAEMLMQSHSEEIALLPALPVQWKSGAVQGFRARGGFEVAITWHNGVLQTATIKSNSNKTCRLRTKTPVKIFCAGAAIDFTTLDDNLIEFTTHAGKTYWALANE